VLRGESPVRLRRVADRAERRASRRGERNRRRESQLDVAPHETGLWQSLRELRARLARDQGVPAYVIFHDATLLQMLRERPQTLHELGAISGVGAAKLARYGGKVLEVMRGADA
jgi:ATP-dependent DNA helicase RecQ